MAQSPPVAPVKVVHDNYHGTIIHDPYRYLEDFRSPAVQQWVKGQADFTAATLEKIPGREALLQRIVELDAGKPFTLGGLTRLPSGDLFYFKQLAGENVAKVYRRDGKSGREHLLLDPETFPKPEPDAHFTISFYASRRMARNCSTVLPRRDRSKRR